MDDEQGIRDTEEHDFDVNALCARVERMAGPGAAAIVRERIRQREVEGWTPEHDDEHADGALAVAAACYAASCEPYRASRQHPGTSTTDKGWAGYARVLREVRSGSGLRQTVAFIDAWPWDESWDKRTRATHPSERRAAIAGALLAAEIDREERAATKARMADDER